MKRSGKLVWFLILTGLVVGLVLSTGKPSDSLDRNLYNLRLLSAAAEEQMQTSAFEGMESHPDSAYGYYGKGITASALQDERNATLYWEKAIEADQKYIYLVRARSRQNVALAEKAVFHYPDNPFAWDWLGDSQGEQYEEALGHYLKAVELDPSRNLTWEKIASVAERLGDLDLALQAARKACDKNRVRSGSCERAARIAYERQEWEITIYYFKRGNYPSRVEDWVKLIQSAINLGKNDEVEHLMDIARQRNPDGYEELLSKIEFK
jgi:tetratricopeptide (TPR) repeat protein